MITKKQKLKATRQSIRHWMLDIRKPLKVGKIIIKMDYYHIWAQEQTSVLCDGEACALCQLYHGCGECLLGANGIKCENDNSPYNTFYEEPNLVNATKMVNALVAVYWETLEEKSND